MRENRAPGGERISLSDESRYLRTLPVKPAKLAAPEEPSFLGAKARSATRTKS